MSVEFIFLLSLNNSGTTIMGQYLQSQTGGYLPPFGNHEGQFAPSVRKVMRAGRWDGTRSFDWAWIRGEWEALAEAEGASLFIECSPPNVSQIEAIREVFDGSARYVFSMASPYAAIASGIYDSRAAGQGIEGLTRFAERWITRADWMRKAMERFPYLPRTTYEAFCADPTVLNRALEIETREAGKLHGKWSSGNFGEIIDFSDRHHAFLTFVEWESVNTVLAAHRDLVEFFGYEIVPGKTLVEKAARNPALFHAGILRRMEWEARGAARRGPAPGKGQRKSAKA